MNQEPDEDSILLCASDLQHAAIFDNYTELRSCVNAVAKRLAALSHPKSNLADSDVIAAPVDHVNAAVEMVAGAHPDKGTSALAIEYIAKQWDGCRYDIVGEGFVDIGECIREAGTKFPQAATQPAEVQSVAPTQEQIARSKAASGSEQTPFEAGCEVLDYLKEQGAAYYYTHRMLTCLHDKNEDEPKYRAEREQLIAQLRKKCAALESELAQPVEVQPESVIVPRSLEAAKLMVLLGTNWLTAHAPGELKVAPVEVQRVHADPMDWPLPCDVTVGHGTMRKGVSLRTLVLRMKTLYKMATGNDADEVAGRTPNQKQVAEFQEMLRNSLPTSGEGGA